MAVTRLDEATLLDEDADWSLTVRPNCNEATMVRRMRPRERSGFKRPDPERSRKESQRRAGVAVRRLVAEHRLTRMWTLTFREETSPEDRPIVVRALQGFIRKLREHKSGHIWLAVIEWHPGGHGWHIHVVSNRWIAKWWLQDHWQHGFVDVRRITVKGDHSSRQAVSKAASYIAKYVQKEPPEGAPPYLKGENRYFRPVGLSVLEISAEGTLRTLYTVALTYFPSGLGWQWSSFGNDQWHGPPCVVLRGA